MDTETDYIEGDQYDWNQSDDSQRCKHGTFIGSWWGPDILCWACEEGLSDEEYDAYIQMRRHDTLVKNATSQLWDDVWPAVHTFTDKIRRDPEAMGHWFCALIDEVKATDDVQLEEYLAWT